MLLGFHFLGMAFFLWFFSVISFFFFWQEKQHGNFLLVAFFSFALAVLLGQAKPHKLDKRITFREGYAVAVLGYFFMALVGALPFYYESQQSTFIDAFFESTSALTTTGFSVFSSTLSKSVVLWRSFQQWLGGAAVLTLFLVVLPSLGLSPVRLVRNEMKAGKNNILSSRLLHSFYSFMALYIFFTVTMLLSLWLTGTSFFAAINLSFVTVSTGGLFSTNTNPVAFWIVLVFMYISSYSYLLHLDAFQGKWHSYWHGSKFIYFHLLVLLPILAIALDLWSHGYGDFSSIIESSFFAVLSGISTTGNFIGNYQSWTLFTQMVLIFLLLVGPMSGAIGGGIKTVRILSLSKQGIIEVETTVHPYKIMSPRFGLVHVPYQTLERLTSYVMLYFFVLAGGLLALSAASLDFEETFLLAVSAISTGGQLLFPDHLLLSEKLHGYSIYTKVVLMYLMLLGRLEILPVLAILQPRFWKR